MGVNIVGSKKLGLFGLFAAIVYTIVLFVTAFTTNSFEIGVNSVNELGSEAIYMFGCIFAGILGIMYSVGVAFQGNDSGVLISKIRGIIFILAAIVLVVVGASKCNETAVLVFEVLILIAIICDVATCWVEVEIIKILIAAFFLTALAVCFATNFLVGFGFALFTAIWVYIMSFFAFTEMSQSHVVDKLESKVEKKKVKENQEKVNKPASMVKQAPVKTEAIKTDNKKLRFVTPSVKPKNERPVLVKTVPVKEQSKEQLNEQPKVESLPKIKVMSSREAAAARQAKMGASAESSRLEPVAKIEPAPAYINGLREEPVDVDISDESEDISDYDTIELEPDTPGALVRRAAWNKGLRCRRDYGVYSIPVAFVKGKVAVFVTTEKEDTSIDSILESEGWTVLRYFENEITDGKVQGEEIAKVVKDNLRAKRAAKKKKQRSKK